MVTDVNQTFVLSDALRYCDSLSGRVAKGAHLREDRGYVLT